MCSPAASPLSCLVAQRDPVRGRRSRGDCRPLANRALLQERRETEPQLLVKTLFIQGDLQTSGLFHNHMFELGSDQ